jgi:hypothetical protein
VENSPLLATAKTEWTNPGEPIALEVPFMTVSGDMSDQSSGAGRVAGVEFRRPDRLQSGPKPRENDIAKRPLHFADRSRSQSDRRRIENDDVSLETFTLPVEAARLKVRDVIDRNPQRGYLEIVERWRQRPDGLIEFAICRLPRRTE